MRLSKLGREVNSKGSKKDVVIMQILQCRELQLENLRNAGSPNRFYPADVNQERQDVLINMALGGQLIWFFP